MKNFISIIGLTFLLSGCSISLQDNKEIKKLFIETWEQGFNDGIKCIEKYNNSITCIEILKNIKERLND